MTTVNPHSNGHVAETPPPPLQETSWLIPPTHEFTSITDTQADQALNAAKNTIAGLADSDPSSIAEALFGFDADIADIEVSDALDDIALMGGDQSPLLEPTIMLVDQATLGNGVLGAFVPHVEGGGYEEEFNPEGGIILLSKDLGIDGNKLGLVSSETNRVLTLRDVALEEMGEAIAEYVAQQDLDIPLAEGDVGNRFMKVSLGLDLLHDDFIEIEGTDVENSDDIIIELNNRERIARAANEEANAGGDADFPVAVLPPQGGATTASADNEAVSIGDSMNELSLASTSGYTDFIEDPTTDDIDNMKVVLEGAMKDATGFGGAISQFSSETYGLDSSELDWKGYLGEAATMVEHGSNLSATSMMAIFDVANYILAGDELIIRVHGEGTPAALAAREEFETEVIGLWNISASSGGEVTSFAEFFDHAMDMLQPGLMNLGSFMTEVSTHVVDIQDAAAAQAESDDLAYALDLAQNIMFLIGGFGFTTTGLVNTFKAKAANESLFMPIFGTIASAQYLTASSIELQQQAEGGQLYSADSIVGGRSMDDLMSDFGVEFLQQSVDARPESAYTEGMWNFADSKFQYDKTLANSGIYELNRDVGFIAKSGFENNQEIETDWSGFVMSHLDYDGIHAEMHEGADYINSLYQRDGTRGFAFVAEAGRDIKEPNGEYRDSSLRVIRQLVVEPNNEDKIVKPYKDWASGTVAMGDGEVLSAQYWLGQGFQATYDEWIDKGLTPDWTPIYSLPENN